MSVSGKRIPLLLSCAVLVLATFVTAFRPQEVYAEQITERSLTLQTGSGGDGGSMPGGEVNHRFEFTLPSVGDPNVGSILFEYCTVASIEPCDLPGSEDPLNDSEIDTTGVTIGDQTGSDVTNWTIQNGTNGKPYLERTGGTDTITAGSTIVVRFDDVINPIRDGQPNYTFFVRISTFASTNATGTPIDTGSVAASTAEQIQLTGVMPESLVFCTGATVSLDGNSIPDCSTATAGDVEFNQLFSPQSTAHAISQMAASTNAEFGYSITVSGPTLTSGVNTIPDMDTATTSVIGTGQFGLNLVLNDGSAYANAPDVTGSADVTQSPNGTNFKGQPTTDFGTAGTFRFVADTTTAVAASDNGGAGPTDSQLFTVSYIVNVSGSQPPGTYVSTVTYVATATF